MVNLITTIIAIALAASVALFGLDYGTRSFDQLRARQQANQVLADARSIVQAWKNYSAAHNGNYVLSDYDWTDLSANNVGASDLITNNSTTTYLSKLPIPPAGITLSAPQNYYFPIKLSNFASSNGVSSVSLVDTVALRITSAALCRMLTKLADDGAPTLKASAGGTDNGLSGDLTAIGARRPFDCVYLDSNSNGTLDDGDAMLFFYTLFN